MITEDYVSYEVAKLLKEKGFPMIEHLFMYVNKDNVFMTNHYACLKLPQEEYKNFYEVYIPTITHQMAMKWLRENKGLFINIGQSKCMSAPIKYRFSIWKDVTYIGKSGDTGDYFTYEEAVETALKYCLTELI